MTDSSISPALVVLGGPLAKRTFPLVERGSLRIGSDPACDVLIPLPGVEQVHARITLQLDGAIVEDGPSRSGVYINDDRVDDARSIKDTDILWLGAPGAPESVMLQFRRGRPAISESVESVAAPEAHPLPIEDFFVADVADTPTVVDHPAPEPTSQFLVDDSGIGFEIQVPVPKKTDTQPIPSIAPEEFFIAETESGTPAAEQDTLIVNETEGAASFSVEPPAPSPLAEKPPPPAPMPPVVAGGGQPVSSAATTPGKASVASKRSIAPATPGPPATQSSSAPGAPPRKAPLATAPVSERMRGARPLRRPALSARAAPRSIPIRARTLPRQARRTVSPTRLLVFLLIVIAAAVGVGYLVLWHFEAPKIEAVTPSPVRVGDELTITGQNFSSDPSENIVLFGEQASNVTSARSTQLVVRVPEVPVPPGHVSQVAMRVRTGARESSAVDVAVYLPPRIQGISPDVGMPGEEVVIAGAGWTSTVAVYFGDVPAEVLAAEATYVRVRVPQINVPQGTSIPIVVAAGEERSNSAPFIMGQLPLVTGTEPTSAAAGDVVRLMGRGFRSSPEENAVRVGGVRALILDAQEDVIRFVVPRLDLSGQIPLEISVTGRSTTALGILGVVPAADPVPFRFIPEPFIDAAGHTHAVLVTGIGPAFVISASGGRTAAQRALAVAQRFNAAADVLRSSRDIDIEIADMESTPRLLLTGRSEPLLEVATEDVAAYTEDWTGQKGSGGLITAARLAAWWRALARDLVLLLLRAESPRHTAAIASEGRILAELYQKSIERGGFGVSRAVLSELSPAQREALRVLAYRVPSSVTVGGEAAVSTTSTTTNATTSTTTATTALRLDRPWRGTEVAEGRTRLISVHFEGDAGTLTYGGGVALSVPILDVAQPRPDAVTFMTEAGGGVRYYAGQWDGQKVSGTISSQPSGTGDLGTFELSW
jgi:pSer/pThr/pTyr-binding forkhead associated (FHA) protein